MAKKLEIIKLGNTLLRQKTQPITNISDTTIQSLIDDMVYTCEIVDGVGIAAPQVGYSLRLFIVASHPNARYPNAPQMEPVAMINPTLLTISEGVATGWEGCLSVPGIRGRVTRPENIIMNYQSRDGKCHEKNFDGFIARIIQHELEHLDGVVFIDKINPAELITDEESQELVTAGTTGYE